MRCTTGCGKRREKRPRHGFGAHNATKRGVRAQLECAAALLTVRRSAITMCICTNSLKMGHRLKSGRLQQSGTSATEFKTE